MANIIKRFVTISCKFVLAKLSMASEQIRPLSRLGSIHDMVFTYLPSVPVTSIFSPRTISSRIHLPDKSAMARYEPGSHNAMIYPLGHLGIMNVLITLMKRFQVKTSLLGLKPIRKLLLNSKLIQENKDKNSMHLIACSDIAKINLCVYNGIDMLPMVAECRDLQCKTFDLHHYG